MGSSPRVRGKRFLRGGFRARGRLIPACAGKTGFEVVERVHAWAHPRVCGENRRNTADRRLPVRLIPACAGKTCANSATNTPTWAHPRVCGENVKAKLVDWVTAGSSPRVRGKQPGERPDARRTGLIPACAGKTGHLPDGHCSRSAHPRVCGENCGHLTTASATNGSSPRVRGKPVGGFDEVGARGLIPACAGKTRR